jgi:hypothetical protein
MSLTFVLLICSLNRRTSVHDLDNEALAFKPVLGAMLGRIYHNPQNSEEYRKRLQQMVEFWASKEVYDQETISLLKGEMIGGPQTNSFSATAKDLSSASADSGAGKLLFFNVKVSHMHKLVNYLSCDN